jgi:hypothetical protein
MRAAAERAFDPQISAKYLALASQWLRLAEQANNGIDWIAFTAGSAPGERPD